MTHFNMTKITLEDFQNTVNEWLQSNGMNDCCRCMDMVYADMFNINGNNSESEKSSQISNDSMAYPILMGYKIEDGVAAQVLCKNFYSDYSKITQEYDSVTTDGITYIKNSKGEYNMYKCHAIVLDLEDIDSHYLSTLLDNLSNKQIFMPSYMLFSRMGVHLYYLLEQPIDLNKERENMNILVSIKQKLIATIKEILKVSKTNLESHLQVVTKSYVGKKIIAYHLNHQKYNVETFQQYFQIDYMECMVEDRLTLKADEVMQYSGKTDLHVIKTASIKPANSKQSNNKKFNKYLCLFIDNTTEKNWREIMGYIPLVAYKCGIPQQKVEEELSLYTLFYCLQYKNDDIHMGNEHLEAMKQYSAKHAKTTYKDILDRLGIIIDKHSRNVTGLSRQENIARVTEQRKLSGKWFKNGKKRHKEVIIHQWRKEHPSGTMEEFVKEDKTHTATRTVKKYWKTFVLVEQHKSTSGPYEHNNYMAELDSYNSSDDPFCELLPSCFIHDLL